jgi:hypothetical protein
MTAGFIRRKTATLLTTLRLRRPKWIASALMEKTGLTVMRTRAWRKILGSIFRGRRFIKPDLRAILRISSGSNPNRKVDGRTSVLSFA